MGVPRRRLGDLRVLRPLKASPARKKATPAPKILESVEGYVDVIEGDLAEVYLYENGHPVPYGLPASRLAQHRLRVGDRFFVDVVESDGGVSGRIRSAPPEAAPAPPEKYLTPDDLDALEDPWET